MPTAWLGLSMMITALLREVNYFANHDSLGEPLVWLILRLRQIKERVDARRLVDRTLGPERPDRVILDDDGTPILLASRAKAGWDEYNTVRIEDSFFKIDAIEQRPDGEYAAVAYVLRELPEDEILRGVVHTDAALPARYQSIVGDGKGPEK
jgi:hypothetical protein